MKSTWFGERERYDFARLLHDADYSLRLDEVFRIFLETSFAALYQPTHKLRFGDICPEEEERYMRSIGRVKNARKIAEALGVLTLAMDRRQYDFLGAVMQELGVNDKNFRGQCFTPPDVSRLMAQMTMGQQEPVPGRTLMLNEPACGGGSMVIEASEVLKGWGFYPWDYCWVAQDVDWKCFAMTYIQTTLCGIPCGVVHGNTLTLEQWRSEWNMIATLHPPKQRQRDESPEEVSGEMIQMQLF